MSNLQEITKEASNSEIQERTGEIEKKLREITKIDL